MSWAVDDLELNGQISVSANPIGVGPPVPISPAFNPILGLLHSSSASLLGDPTAFPAPLGNVMISKSSDLKLKFLPALIVRGGKAPPTPIDVTIGDPAGPVGVTVFTGPSNILITTAALIGQGALTWNGVKIFNGAETKNGAKADTGAAAETGAKARSGPACVNGPQVTQAEHTGPTQIRNDTRIAAVQAIAGKGFDLPHPTKKDHRLRYICLEGPEVGAYIRGKLEDSNVIELPDYWRELVYPESITVNLTPYGHYQELFVDKIEWGTRVIVKNNAGSSIRCHYTIFAERITKDKLQPEYKGLTPDDYPGDNSEYALGGWDYATHKGRFKTSDI